MALYRRSASFTQKLLPSQKISLPYNHYIMKIILSDAESCEEHNEAKYSPIGQMMVELWSFLCLDVGKITERNENLNESSTLNDCEEGNFPRMLC